MHALIQSLKEDVTSFIENQQDLMFNERDFQIQLSVALLKSGRYDKVYVEYFVPKSVVRPFGYCWDREIYLDIVVEKGGKYGIVELKYPTQELEAGISRFGTLIADEEIKVLKTHAAYDIRSYDFWKDVRRIEIIKAKFSQNVVGGLAVMLTNADYYTRGPKPGTLFSAFSTANGRTGVHGKLSWARKTSTTDGKPDITLAGTYSVKWHEKKNKICGATFHYTIIAI